MDQPVDYNLIVRLSSMECVADDDACTPSSTLSTKILAPCNASVQPIHPSPTATHARTHRQAGKHLSNVSSKHVSPPRACPRTPGGGGARRRPAHADGPRRHHHPICHSRLCHALVRRPSLCVLLYARARAFLLQSIDHRPRPRPSPGPTSHPTSATHPTPPPPRPPRPPSPPRLCLCLSHAAPPVTTQPPIRPNHTSPNAPPRLAHAAPRRTRPSTSTTCWRPRRSPS